MLDSRERRLDNRETLISQREEALEASEREARHEAATERARADALERELATLRAAAGVTIQKPPAPQGRDAKKGGDLDIK